jgi:hypothetical protein
MSSGSRDGREPLAFNVTAYTAGYTRGIGTFRNLHAGIGAYVTAHEETPRASRFTASVRRAPAYFAHLRLKPGG